MSTRPSLCPVCNRKLDIPHFGPVVEIQGTKVHQPCRGQFKPEMASNPSSQPCATPACGSCGTAFDQELNNILDMLEDDLEEWNDAKYAALDEDGELRTFDDEKDLKDDIEGMILDDYTLPAFVKINGQIRRVQKQHKLITITLSSGTGTETELEIMNETEEF